MALDDTVELIDVTHAGSGGWTEVAVKPGPEVVTEEFTDRSVDVAIGGVQVVLDSNCMGKIFVDGNEMHHVRAVTLEARVGRVPVVTIERYCLPKGNK